VEIISKGWGGEEEQVNPTKNAFSASDFLKDRELSQARPDWMERMRTLRGKKEVLSGGAVPE